jgi:hypothetical protein
MSPKELDSIAKMCRKHGITSLKTAQVELTFSPEALTIPKPKEELSEPSKSLYTDEEILMWSSSGIPIPENQ